MRSPGFAIVLLPCGGRPEAVEPFLVLRLDLVVGTVEPAHRDHLRQRGKPTHVVAVVVADHDVIDPLEPGRLRGGKNPLRVPVARLVPGVNQHRFSRRSHDQRRRATLDVDPVDVERAGLRREQPGWNEQQCEQDERPHDGPPKKSGRLKPAPTSMRYVGARLQPARVVRCPSSTALWAARPFPGAVP